MKKLIRKRNIIILIFLLGVTIDDVTEKWNQIVAGSDERKVHLDNELAKQREIDIIRREFAEKGNK